MNKVLPLLVLCWVCGCGQDQRDAKIAKLEARVSALETRYQHLDNRLTNLLDTVQTLVQENKRFSSELGTITRETQNGMNALVSSMDGVGKALRELQASLTNRTPRQTTR